VGKRLSRPIAAYLRYIEGIKRDRQLGSGLRGRSLNLKKQVQKVVLAQRVSGNLTNCETIVLADKRRMVG
jgi:hypothetical protein